MHVKGMGTRTVRTLQYDAHGLAPIFVRDNHEVSFLRCRGDPRRVLLDGVKGRIGSVVDRINPTVHECVDLGTIDIRECVIEKE